MHSRFIRHCLAQTQGISYIQQTLLMHIDTSRVINVLYHMSLCYDVVIIAVVPVPRHLIFGRKMWKLSGTRTRTSRRVKA